jgi:hypothetical protein
MVDRHADSCLRNHGRHRWVCFPLIALMAVAAMATVRTETSPCGCRSSAWTPSPSNHGCSPGIPLTSARAYLDRARIITSSSPLGNTS